MTPPNPLLVLVSLVLSGAVSASAPPALCDVTDVVLDVKNNPNLGLPSQTKPNYIAWGAGTQNYACQNGKYNYVGEVVELIDISCLVNTKDFSELRKRDDNVWQDPDDIWTHEASVRRMLGPEAKVLGRGYSVRADNGTYPSTYDFANYLGKGDSCQYITGYWMGNVTAPKAQDVDWWKLGRANGDLAEYVYRVDTHGGQPPTSCKAGLEFIEIRFSAKFYFYGKPTTYSASSLLSGGAINAAAVSDDDSSNIQKLLSYVPTVLGLLVVTTLLSLVLVTLGAVAMYGRRRRTVPTRSSAYRPVQLPRSKVPQDGSYHDDLEPYGA